jgi:TonB family protein
MTFDVFPLIFILIFGISAVSVSAQNNQTNPCNRTGNGSGFAGDNAGLAIDPAPTPKNSFDEKAKVYPVGTKPLQILSKPRAFYTKLADEKCIEGVVVLKITFYANGQVRNIKVVKGLPYGLTEQAITVAKRIRFEPAMKRGKPISVTKKVSYTFTIY